MEQISLTATTAVHAHAQDQIINTQPHNTIRWAEHLKQATRSTCLVVVSLILVLDGHLLAIPKTIIFNGEIMVANTECDGPGRTIVVDMYCLIKILLAHTTTLLYRTPPLLIHKSQPIKPNAEPNTHMQQIHYCKLSTLMLQTSKTGQY